MQLEQELEAPFHYSIIGIILLILMILIIITYILYRLYKKYHKDKPKPNIVMAPPENIFRIKNRYLFELDRIERLVQSKRLSTREAYNNLSRIIRKFVFDATGIDAMKYSLEDIKELDNKYLTLLMEEYYEPEFSKEGEGNIELSIKKTRGVIKKWN